MPEIVKTEGVLAGKARLAGRRVSVFQIGEMYTDANDSPEHIADQLSLSLAEVHSALAYYYDHPAEMDEIRDRWAILEESLREESVAPDSHSS